jgi:type I restriction-modification system DNA methylase subunit
MHIKKSELYSPLWQSCDELRGGLDPSQYKDCVRGMMQELLMGRTQVT